MRLLAGAVATVAGVLGFFFVLVRITSGVEGWFATSGAADVLMWSVVSALVIAVFAVPLGAYGLAARMWLVKMREGEYLESAPEALRSPARKRARVRR